MAHDDGREDVGGEVETLRHQLEETRKAQAGSDRRVTELDSERQRLQEELDKLKASQDEASQQTDQQFREKQAMLDRKERAVQLAIERNLPPAEAIALLGLDESDDETRLDKLVERDQNARLEERQSFAKRHGVKPVNTARLKTDGGTYEDMLKMDDSQIKRLPDSEISRRIEQGSKAQGSVRSKIRRDLGGK